MPFNSPQHRDQLHTLSNYVSAPTFLSSVGWGQDGSASMLKNKRDKEDSILIVVGKVNKDRVFCGPAGNWFPTNTWGNLRKAKYTFMIGPPDEDTFAQDFDTAFKSLAKLQANIASTQNREHLLLGEGEKIHNIRFSANVFEERDIVRYFF
jgi:hypothetical protein